MSNQQPPPGGNWPQQPGNPGGQPGQPGQPGGQQWPGQGGGQPGGQPWPGQGGYPPQQPGNAPWPQQGQQPGGPGQQPGYPQQGGYGGGFQGGGYGGPPGGPGGPGAPGGGGSNKKPLLIGIAVLAVLAIVAGVTTFLVTRGGDDDNDAKDDESSQTTSPSPSDESSAPTSASTTGEPSDPATTEPTESTGAAVEIPTPGETFTPEDSFDLSNVCNGQQSTNAAAWDPSDPRIFAYEELDWLDYDFFPAFVGYGEDWGVDTDKFKEANLVSCLKRVDGSEEKVKTCRIKDSGDRYDVDVYTSDWVMYFLEAGTAEQVGEPVELTSKFEDCPTYATEGEDYYQSVGFIDTTAAINTFVSSL